MKEVTSAVANKLLRKYNEDLKRLYNEETQCSTYTEIVGMNPTIPEYDFLGTRHDVRELMTKISKLKHAINVFNSTTVLKNCNMTIDEALVYMSMLTKEKDRLESLIVPVSRKLKTGFDARNNHVEYTVLNYDVPQVREKYENACQLLTDIQIELDTVNSTVTFEIPD